MTDDPDLHLLVDGVRVDAVDQFGSVRVFRLDRARARSSCIGASGSIWAEVIPQSPVIPHLPARSADDIVPHTGAQAELGET